MATAQDIITAASIKIGVESPSAGQLASALVSLNNLVSLMGAEMLQPVVVSESFSLVVNDPEYTIGSGGQWNTTRPMKINTCFIRDDDNIDWPVKILSANDFRDIFNKSTYSGNPTALYFLPEYPLAKIIFDMLPAAALAAYFEFMKNFTEFAALSTTVALPAEYKEMLVYNLAVSLGEDWDRVIGKTVIANSIRTREVIDRMNAAARPVSEARLDVMGGNTRMLYPMNGAGANTGSVIDGGPF